MELFELPKNFISKISVISIWVIFILLVLYMAYKAIGFFIFKNNLQSNKYIDSFIQKTDSENEDDKQITNTIIKRFKSFFTNNFKNILKRLIEGGISNKNLNFDNFLYSINNELFRSNDFIRNILSVFIIIGLFGTLGGLSIMLSGLNQLQYLEDIEGAKLAISGLISNLGDAFKPSIWGVGCTIILIFTYNIIYNRLFCIPLQKEIEYFSIYKLPEIVNTQIYKNREVDLNGEEVETGNREDMDNLKDFLKSSTEYIKNIRVADTGTTNLKGLLALQEQINISFAQVEQVVRFLQKYESDYLDYRTRIDKRNDEVFKEAQVVINNFRNVNEEFISILSTKFQEIVGVPLSDRIEIGLRGIKESFDLFNIPINNAADNISNALETVVRRTDTLTKELQGQFLAMEKSNSASLESLIEELSKQNNRNHEIFSRANELQKEQLISFNQGLKLIFNIKHPYRSRFIDFFNKINKITKITKISKISKISKK